MNRHNRWLLCTALCILAQHAFADLPGRPPGAPSPSTSFLPGEDVSDAMGAPTTPGPLCAVGDVTKSTAPNVVFYDFQTVSAEQTKPIEHNFSLRNTSSKPVVIDHVAPGCDCTTASLVPPGVQKIIDAGQTAQITVSIDPQKLYIGPINKIVWIFLAGQSTPAFTLHMIGAVVPAAAFNTSCLDFGTISRNTATTKQLIVITDSRFYGKHPPEPYSLHGEVRIIRDTNPAVITGSQLARTYNINWKDFSNIGLQEDVITVPKIDGTGRSGPSMSVTAILTPQRRPN